MKYHAYGCHHFRVLKVTPGRIRLEQNPHSANGEQNFCFEELESHYNQGLEPASSDDFE